MEALGSFVPQIACSASSAAISQQQAQRSWRSVAAQQGRPTPGAPLPPALPPQVRSHEPILALWSLSALATSLASLALMRWHPALLATPSFREPWYAGVRLHRAIAVAGMRRILKASQAAC